MNRDASKCYVSPTLRGVLQWTASPADSMERQLFMYFVRRPESRPWSLSELDAFSNRAVAAKAMFRLVREGAISIPLAPPPGCAGTWSEFDRDLDEMAQAGGNYAELFDSERMIIARSKQPAPSAAVSELAFWVGTAAAARRFHLAVGARTWHGPSLVNLVRRMARAAAAWA